MEKRLMPLFGRKAPESPEPDNAFLAEFVKIAAGLTSAEASRVEEAAMHDGFVRSRDLSLAVAMIINGGMVLKIDGARKRAQKAGRQAIESGPGRQGGYLVLAYAAGVMAEAFVVREALDPKTWAFITGPWVTIFEIPPLYEGEEPEAIAKARTARASVE
jgi:hypothetical protein